MIIGQQSEKGHDSVHRVTGEGRRPTKIQTWKGTIGDIPKEETVKINSSLPKQKKKC